MTASYEVLIIRCQHRRELQLQPSLFRIPPER